MIVMLKEGTPFEQRNNLCNWFETLGLRVRISEWRNKTIIGLIGNTGSVDVSILESLAIVDSVKELSDPFKKANKKFQIG